MVSTNSYPIFIIAKMSTFSIYLAERTISISSQLYGKVSFTPMLCSLGYVCVNRIDCWLFNIQWLICHEYSGQEQIQQYIKIFKKNEVGAGQPGQQLLTDTVKVWNVGYGRII
jgi:hypothetical protein